MSNIPACVQIDEMHCQAIRQEIGERLRFELKDTMPIPPKLVWLMERLRDLDHHDSPSIVPSHEDVVGMVEELADAF